MTGWKVRLVQVVVLMATFALGGTAVYIGVKEPARQPKPHETRVAMLPHTITPSSSSKFETAKKSVEDKIEPARSTQQNQPSQPSQLPPIDSSNDGFDGGEHSGEGGGGENSGSDQASPFDPSVFNGVYKVVFVGMKEEWELDLSDFHQVSSTNVSGKAVLVDSTGSGVSSTGHFHINPATRSMTFHFNFGMVFAGYILDGELKSDGTISGRYTYHLSGGGGNGVRGTLTGFKQM